MKIQERVFVLAAALITMATAAENPCNGQSRYFPYTIDPHRYIMCDDIYGPLILFCPLNYVWDQALQTCVPPGVEVHVTTTQPPVVIGTSIIISRGYTAPCTEENIQLANIYFAYPYDQTKYIQCDLWGVAYLKSCHGGLYFSPVSGTCV